jgi:putative RecB family exonuclease
MFEVPTSLSPSRVESFINCPMAFRFASIEKIPEPPTVPTTRGSLVHRALELLFLHPPAERHAHNLGRAVDAALEEYHHLDDYQLLHLSEEEAEQFERDCRDLAARYLEMEDPVTVREIGLEIRLSADLNGIEIRGIIDRLELNHSGELVITDYKTGRAPGPKYEAKSLQGVQVYAWLCEEVFGQRPSEVRLMYLKSAQVISATPTAQSVKHITTRTLAVHRAVEKACHTGDFRPQQSALCQSCSFQPWCPAFGGDPSRAIHEAPAVLRGPS